MILTELLLLLEVLLLLLLKRYLPPDPEGVKTLLVPLQPIVSRGHPCGLVRREDDGERPEHRRKTVTKTKQKTLLHEEHRGETVTVTNTKKETRTVHTECRGM